LKLDETILPVLMFNRQANTRPADHPPSSQPDIPRKGKQGGGKTWPASFFYLIWRLLSPPAFPAI